MESTGSKYLQYKRSHFSTQLPISYLYSPSHYWIADQGNGIWRIGFTKFAVRMLGEMVDHGFEIEPSTRVEPGQVLGWFEGFKAMADVYCIASGQFQGRNDDLAKRLNVTNKDPYGAGWLYEVVGQPDPLCMKVEEYKNLLDRTIDKMLEKQSYDDESSTHDPA